MLSCLRLLIMCNVILLCLENINKKYTYIVFFVYTFTFLKFTMYEFFLHVYIYIHVYAVPLEARKDIRSPGTVVTYGCEQSSIGFVRIK